MLLSTAGKHQSSLAFHFERQCCFLLANDIDTGLYKCIERSESFHFALEHFFPFLGRLHELQVDTFSYQRWYVLKSGLMSGAKGNEFQHCLILLLKNCGIKFLLKSNQLLL